MTKTFLSSLIFTFLFSSLAVCQYDTGIRGSDNIFAEKNNYSLKNIDLLSGRDDSAQVSNGKNKVQKISIGGLFLAPYVGIGYPLGTFESNSGVAFVYGAKLEIAFSKLYPFVPGIVYESQAYKGAAGFISNNLLTDFSTEIIYFGGSIDIILNKFLRSDFTTPVFTGEVKYATITRTVNPDVEIEGIVDNESLLTFSTGLTFTLYVFDLGVKYTYADVYSNLALQLKIHLPLVKF